jgi:hypothetical protein
MLGQPFLLTLLCTAPLLAASSLGEPRSSVVGAAQADGRIRVARSTDVADLQTADWITNSSDNVCGLRDPRMLSNPAKIDYDALLAATPEMEKVKKDGIQPDSVEGIQLKQKAIDRVTKACESVRVAQGHCSVWKTISHKDARSIPDITSLVKAKL